MDKNFEIKKFVFTKNNIKKFIKYNFSRPLHEIHLNKIRKSTINDKFIIGNVIIVNELNDLFYVINGGHRIEVYKKLLDERITENITSGIIIYKNLTEDEIKIKMRVMGLVDRIQDLDSLLEVYREEIYILKHQEEFPISIDIKHRKNFFRLKWIIYILQSYTNSRMNYGKSTEGNLDFILNLNSKDINFLKEYLTFFKENFGDYNKENKLWNKTFIIPFGSIYYLNKDKVLNNKKILNLWKDKKVDDILSYTGRNATQKMRDRIIQILEIEEDNETNL